MSTSPTDEGRSSCTCAGSHGAGEAAVPVTSSFGPYSRSVAMPSRMSRLGVLSSRRRISREYSSLSVCALSAHTAGPCMQMGELLAYQLSPRDTCMHQASAVQAAANGWNPLAVRMRHLQLHRKAQCIFSSIDGKKRG